MRPGTLYLIPSPLGASELARIVPDEVRQLAAQLDTFIVEHPKTARHFLKQIGTLTPLQQLHISVLDEHTQDGQLMTLLQPLLNGKDVGLLSEAGCPGVADPGANLVRLAHAQGIRVAPMVGPSSILLALMASGLNGQRFTFHGYLPIAKDDRKKKLVALEQESLARDQTQIFIETPYRNLSLLEAVLATCKPDTLLCIATDITLSTEIILTKPLSKWCRPPPPDIDKKPTVFLLYSTKRATH